MRGRRDLKLTDCWLYAIASPADLARRLSTPKNPVLEPELRQLARDAGNFRLFVIEGSNGKFRPIQWPKRKLQTLHKRVHRLLSRVEAPIYLHSAVHERSYISNAKAHDPAAPTIKVDVKSFYPSVSRVAIFNFFAGPLKCRSDVAGLMADLLTFDAHLATGSSASSIIAFYAFKPMFDEIAAVAKTYDLTMSCYVDDITLSGSQANKATLFEIRRIIARFGLKSHKCHVFSASAPKVVTGVCNTVEGRKVPNKLHQKIKLGFEALSAASTANEKAKVSIPLMGRLEAAGQIDPRFHARANTLRAQLLK